MSLKTTERDSDDAATERPTKSTAFRLARLLFGGALALTALDNFRDLDGMIAYADSEGAPRPEAAVPAISGALVFGGAGLAVWKLPRLAAGAVATFLAATTPLMHDFWTIDDEAERDQQQAHFVKNLALLGGALAFLGIADDER
ncbi:DoxX family protein [Halorussus marinus]|uniref:DoxX family protein n=1 Tax=Halorussus marinus TaxID=2505976 RepID=UPI00106E9E96|nr:DoxX family protein [Halorussus marinus]